MKSSVQQEVRGQALVLTLDVPQRGNAFGPQLIEDLEKALAEIPAVGCDTVIFQGAGKGFCGGLDLADLADETDATLLTRLIRIEMLLQRIARLSQRTVALVHGFAYGAGADLALACRQRVAAPECRFAFPGVRFGIALGTGRLARLVGPDLAWELLARSTPISCVEAHNIGMVGRVLPQDDWLAIIEDYAQAKCSLNQRMAAIVAERLDAKQDDADLAALVRSAALPGLRERVASYAARARAAG